MKKTRTDYSFIYPRRQTPYSLTVNEESSDYISIYEGYEPCSGVLKQWGTRQELIDELLFIIKAIRESTTPDEKTPDENN